ncbi:3-deoxy-D-manno-octulosonate 8-phosphate phosphatase [Bacteroidota bacterium]|nr:3-deoxy-D-manno-octulosonate 8-phosphate phosphatase [Bacteroidota bacterium]
MANHPFLSKLKTVKAIALDVDGVLTDGSLIINEDGTEVRSMNIRDGYAIQLAAKKGIELCVISGGNSEGVKIRLHKLGVQTIFAGIIDKKDAFLHWLQQKKLKPEEVIYLGDDMLDIEVMKLAGIKCCPADACNEIIALCEYVSPLNGGKGCVRDVIEKTLKLQGKWE